MSDALTHITLSTGHARLSSPTSSRDDIISMIRPLLGDFERCIAWTWLRG